MALIRYQDLPETVFPAQVARQKPPVTLLTTVTLVPVLRVVLRLAVVYGLVRRLTLQAAFLGTLARAVPGRDTAVNPNTNRADSMAVITSVGSDERRVERTV
jgi:hypothetical protein